MRVIEQGTIELRAQEAGIPRTVLNSVQIRIGPFGAIRPVWQQRSSETSETHIRSPTKLENLRRVSACKQSQKFLGLSPCSNLDFNNYFDPHHFISFVWNSEPRASVCVSLLKKFLVKVQKEVCKYCILYTISSKTPGKILFYILFVPKY